MLDEIFQALLQNSQSQPTQPQTTGQQNMLSQLLQGALQGQQPPSHANEPDNLAGMAGLLSGLLGTTSPVQNQPSPLIAPIANMLAEKLDIPPSIASMVVNFALTALLARGKRQPSSEQNNVQQPTFDLEDIIHGDFAFSSGMAQQISRQTGLSEEDAAHSLQEALLLLNEQATPSKPSPFPNNDLFDGFIDSLKVDIN